MAGFFGKLFGNKKPEIRKLSHPRDLQEGDIIKLSFLDQDDISGQEFQISQVNNYLYDGISYPELILKGKSSKPISMMVEEEDGEEYLAFSKKLSKSQAVNLLGEDLDKIIKKGTGFKISITNKPEALEQWLANKYSKTEDNVKGSFVKGNISENFTSYLLTDSSDEYALEIEKYDSNEIEVSVTIYHDFTAIEEMWPKNL
ncbi:hypothetical protein N9C35_02245 [Flavobacteriaceae bacterium]|nr:hypothetical protein [Flavobacteriaceae bacterium]